MITRAVALDVVFESSSGMAGTVHGWAVDADGTTPARSAEVQIRVDGHSTLLEMTGADALPADLRASLDGVQVASGFRRRVAPLAEGNAEQRLLRRLMWELPIVVRIAGGARVVDHPAIPKSAGMMGVAPQLIDLCSGWRSGGVMVTMLSEATTPQLMELGPEREAPGPAGPWLDLPTLPPLSMRRSRVLSLDGDAVSLLHRDWITDPDGVLRGLHEWNATAILEDARDGPRYAKIEVTSGKLPWPECPSAGGSGAWLEGKTPAEIEQIVSSDFLGIGTCTHLNDMLRMLGDVSDLMPLQH